MGGLALMGALSAVGGAVKKYQKNRQKAKDTGDSYKQGGRVKETGLAKLEAGERVLTKKQARKYRAKGARKSSGGK